MARRSSRRSCRAPHILAVNESSMARVDENTRQLSVFTSSDRKLSFVCHGFVNALLRLNKLFWVVLRGLWAGWKGICPRFLVQGTDNRRLASFPTRNTPYAWSVTGFAPICNLRAPDFWLFSLGSHRRVTRYTSSRSR